MTSAQINDLGLDKVGINEAETIFYNLSYDELYDHEVNYTGDDFGKGTVTATGAVSVDTGRFTGRSAQDKYIVEHSDSKENVWWAGTGSDNKKISGETWAALKANSLKRLNGKKLYVMDVFCGANESTRLSIRLITEVAWKAHFAKNMFIRPTDDELKNFSPDWTILDSCKTDFKEFADYGLRSEVYAAFNIEERCTVIGGTWYGGEIKKGIFTMMNYFLPLKGIGSFHCSANKGKNGDTALFFGLSGTGKTTLSTDPQRSLIGDDEHGWDNDGVFNFEGGCYAKTIDLSKDSEPEIYGAIKKDALLENVVLKADKSVDFHDTSKNTKHKSIISYLSYRKHC